MRRFTQNSILLLFLGGFLRFSYLTWGNPYFFHPDENNIAYAINNMNFSQWNPHFFAYGSLPIYVAFLASQLISLGHMQFGIIIYTLRFISAFLSFALLFLIFFVGKKFYGKTTGIIATTLAATSVGLIQFAHFGTFEMWLSFFTLLFAYSCYKLYLSVSLRNILFVSIAGGILLSIKISSLVFIPLPLLVVTYFFIRRKLSAAKMLKVSLVYSSIVFLFYCITNPFIFLDMPHAINSLSYESSVAIGTLPVFYTQSFLHTIPLVYQLIYVFPFLLNPFVLAAFLIGLIYFCIFILREQKIQDKILLVFLVIILLSQATVFVKWTRYMVPTLPFIYLIIARVITHFKSKKIIYGISIFLTFISTVYAFAFFFTVYPIDSRIAASNFAQQFVKNKTAIIEPYDLGTMAFTNIFPNATVINLYDLDTNVVIQQQLQASLKTSQIFLSPSQRLWSTRMQNKNDFPLGNIFYRKLFDGSLGYKIIYQTPCNFWCTLVYMGNPATHVEATASVFDHPVVTILKHE